MIAPVLVHLVESTLFAAVAALLMFALRVRQPGVRHAVWLLVAVKFALPAALFTGLGGNLRAWAPQPIPIVWSGPEVLLARVSALPVHAPVSRFPVEAAMLCLWIAGAIFALGIWLSRWLSRPIPATPASALEIAILQRLRTLAGVRRAVALRHSSGWAAPGLSGIRKPVISVPSTLVSDLEPAEFEAVLLHELAHLRRWDNLCSAIVHAIACVFWFYPLTWWIEREIGREAERACDQLVIGWGTPRESYASGILKVCRLQIAVPLAGVSGFGSNLSDRIEWIVSNRIGQRGGYLDGPAVAVLAIAMMVAPLAAGFLAGPARAAKTAAPAALPEVHSTATVTPDRTPHTRASRQRKGKSQPMSSSVAQIAVIQGPPAPQVWCAYNSVYFPEGTVARQGHSDRMCVRDASGGPSWDLAETAGRPRVGEILDFNVFKPGPEPKPSYCEPRISPSPDLCACSYGPVSPGAVVRDQVGGRLVCDREFLRDTAEWRPAIPGKDDR